MKKLTSEILSLGLTVFMAAGTAACGVDVWEVHLRQHPQRRQHPRRLYQQMQQHLQLLRRMHPRRRPQRQDKTERP